MNFIWFLLANGPLKLREGPSGTSKQGNPQYVEAGRWHGGKVISSEPMRLLGLMIVDKDKPIIEVVK